MILLKEQERRELCVGRKESLSRYLLSTYCMPTSELGTEIWERNPCMRSALEVLTVCWGKANTQLQYMWRLCTEGELRNKTVN